LALFSPSNITLADNEIFLNCNCMWKCWYFLFKVQSYTFELSWYFSLSEWLWFWVARSLLLENPRELSPSVVSPTDQWWVRALNPYRQLSLSLLGFMGQSINHSAADLFDCWHSQSLVRISRWSKCLLSSAVAGSNPRLVQFEYAWKKTKESRVIPREIRSRVLKWKHSLVPLWNCLLSFAVDGSNSGWLLKFQCACK
jgi:hypothetical protein